MEVEQQEVEPKIARPYQVQLFEHAVKQNSIIYLPTGSGKTYIAIMLLRHYSKCLQKPISEGGKRNIFMCNTVELARQTVTEIVRSTNFTVGFFVGEMNVDNWSADKWETELNKNQVFVGTSQVFVDMIAHNRLSLSCINCVIIDECHHATKAHAMHSFLSFFMYANQAELPRVVGLTGVLLKTVKLNDFVNQLIELEAVFRGKIITVQNLNDYHNVLTYSTCAKESILPYVQLGRQFSSESDVYDILVSTSNCISLIDIGTSGKPSKNLERIQEQSKSKQVKALLADFKYQLQDMGVYAGSISILNVILQLEINKRNAETTTLRNMYRYAVTQCECIRHILVKKLQSQQDDDSDEDETMNQADIILNFSTPKLQALLSFIVKEFGSKAANDINCLIFVKRRYTAKCLYSIIKNFVSAYTRKNLSHIIPDHIVGRNSNMLYAVDCILDSKWSSKAVERFRRKECNIVVCSSVLEEGIDVQACNYVIAFDEITHFTSYVQMKGRARSRDSAFIIVCAQSKSKEVAIKINGYQKIDSELKKYLIERTIDREIPDKSITLQQFYEVIKPFQTKSGAILRAESSVSLLYRYCQLLPHDLFSHANPVWTLESTVPRLLTLTLPMQSKVKESIKHTFVESTHRAKMICAFKACILLYQNGELDENLFPITKKQIIENVSDLYFAKWKTDTNTSENELLAGTKKNQRIYEKLCPIEWKSALPVIGKLAYAYCIKIEPTFKRQPDNEHIYDLLQTNSNFAMVLQNKMPALAAMPLFMTQGELRVTISTTPTMVNVPNERMLKKLKMFHKLLFSDIVKCWKKFLALSDGDSNNSFVIAPVLGDGTIDWDIVNNFQELSPLRKKSMTDRVGKTYNPSDFLGKIVSQWYNDKNEDIKFVVTKIRDDLNPLSPFPDSVHQFTSYAHFVKSKYGEDVYNKKQFLLEVKPLTSRVNFYINSAGKSSEKRSKKILQFIFIPEMCHNYNFPGDLWLKALLLPSIIHRTYYLLHAEGLRLNINQFLRIPSDCNYSPKPIEVDFSLRRTYNDEIEKEYRKILPPLESTRNDTSETHLALVDVEQGNWKIHMEPIDFERNLNKIYPIEVDYYHQFVNNLLEDLENLTIEGITTDQVSVHKLKAHQPKIIIPKKQNFKQAAIEGGDVTNQASGILDCYVNPKSITTAEQIDFLSAITTASTNDVFDMERFEVLGDSFLKFSVSLLLMHRHSDWHEGFLTAIKSRIVSNRNLLYCMRSKYNATFIRSFMFQPVTEWLPPLATVPKNFMELVNADKIHHNCIYDLELSYDEVISGICEQETLEKINKNALIIDSSMECLFEFVNMQNISDKVVADCLEAILGVCVRRYGVHKSFEMLDYFGIYNDPRKQVLPKLLNTNLGNPLVRASTKQSEIDEYILNYQYLETNLGYKFKDRAYLLQALTHPSYPTNRLTGCYERLEFIGDALLDFLISCYIFETCKHMDPGQITDLRSSLVNNVTLACICVRNRFHQFMLYTSPTLSESIRKFADFQESHDHQVTEQVKILIEESVTPNGYNMAQNIDVPKALGDIFESIIGAVFLDSNNNLLVTWNVIQHLMSVELDKFIAQVPINPVRQLYEYRGANPKFEVSCVEENVVMVECKFYCRDFIKTVIGCGCNKSMAKKAAAKMALQIIYAN